MIEILDIGEFERLLSETRQLIGDLDRLDDESARGTVLDGLESTGESASGQVRATVAAGGRLVGLEIDPRAMRLGSQDLAVAIAEAVNSAHDRLEERLADRSGGAGYQASMAMVDEAQDRTAIRLQSFADELEEAARRIAET